MVENGPTPKKSEIFVLDAFLAVFDMSNWNITNHHGCFMILSSSTQKVKSVYFISAQPIHTCRSKRRNAYDHHSSSFLKVLLSATIFPNLLAPFPCMYAKYIFASSFFSFSSGHALYGNLHYIRKRYYSPNF